MKKISKLLAVACVGLFISSCAVTVPYAATDQPIGSKTGISATSRFLNFEFNGEHGVAEAAKNGGIQGPISTVDIRTTNYIFLFSKREIIVTGE
jgi:hypothetical protein